VVTTLDTLQADVCVVGAGFAGLTAALRLQQAGRSVVVLEARDRIGGRVYTGYLPDGTWLDYGGTWIGPGQDRVYALAAEMGVETYPTYDQGDSLMVMRDGTIVRTPDSVTINGLFTALAVWAVLEQFEEMAGKVPLDAPWTAEQAREWDRQTLAGWVEAQFDGLADDARDAVNDVFGGLFTATAAEVSLLEGLFFIHSQESFQKLMSTTGGNQQDRIKGGAQVIADRVAARLGDAVRLSAPVRAIAQDETGVTVTAGGVSVRAQRVIVSIPPTLAGHIAYDPELTHERTLLMQAAPGGSVIKALAVYDEPFWWADGLTGLSTAFGNPLQLTIDGSPDSGKPGIIVGLSSGPESGALARRPPDERRAVVLDELRKRFGPKAATPIHYAEHDWTVEAWSRGCYFAHLPAGVLTTFGSALRDPVGRIHWAGTETATACHGSIDGAVRSGERVADEVVVMLAERTATV
jgi:monoamine oxidase